MAVAGDDGTLVTENEGNTTKPDPAPTADQGDAPRSGNTTQATTNTTATAAPAASQSGTTFTEAIKDRKKLGEYARTMDGKRLLMIILAAIFVALTIAFWSTGKPPEYKVLFSNFSDRDGGAIIDSLQQMQVPYKYSEGGGSIMIPADKIYDTRLKLAAQGLPKGGNVGFEVLEQQKFGTSQFVEQINFQRAMEGELAQSIQTVAAVESARVHLALPKASVFVRDQPKPTASIILTLYSGRSLDNEQVNAIIHLVASSVPQLTPKNVTIVDQHGTLLSDTSANPTQKMLMELLQNGKLTQEEKHLPGMDPKQIKYVQDMQSEIAKRVENIITPIVGKGNVRAEATVDIDFTVTEQSSEFYRPNQTIEIAAVRSQQSREIINETDNTRVGIPGALTNQPPAPAIAPIEDPLNPQRPGGTSTGHRDVTINYELDKTVRHTPQQIIGLKRITVAAVVNYKPEIGADGKVTLRALTEEERNQITELVKEAMGFNQDRGDSVNVMNTQFPEAPALPAWQQPQMVSMGMEIGKYLMLAIALLFLYFAVVRPLVWKATGKTDAIERARLEEEQARQEAEKAAALAAQAITTDGTVDPDGAVVLSEEARESLIRDEYLKNLELVRQWIRQDSKLAANIIKIWVGE